jgi:hypothetical protein
MNFSAFQPWKKIVFACFLLTCVALLTAEPATAGDSTIQPANSLLPSQSTDTIFEQPPNQAGLNISDSSQNQIFADNFILPTEAAINQVVFWGCYAPGNIPSDTDRFTVSFYADQGSLPAMLLQRFTDIPSSRQQTGIVLFGYDEYEFVINFGSSIILPPGTYWVEISNDTTDNQSSNFYWERGTLDSEFGIPNCAYYSSANWYGYSEDLAFRLGYRNETSPTTVPTLSEWGLIILVCLTVWMGISSLPRRRHPMG